MKCPNCKNEVSPEWKRCPYCEYKPNLCSKEGCKSGWLPAEAHFCPSCGSPVKGEENLRIKEIIENAVAAVSPLRHSDSSTPSGGGDDLTFTDEADYNRFWQTFKHYSRNQGWQFKDFSSDVEDTFTTDLNIFKR